MNVSTTAEITNRLNDLRRTCPEMRFGQMLATLGELGQDMVDRSLWDIEDEQFITVIDRFRNDLVQRQSHVA